MKRREFITLLGGAAAAWPLAARAQQAERDAAHRRAACSLPDDPEWQTRIAAFLQRIARVGLGRRPQRRIEYRWSGGAPARTQHASGAGVALAPMSSWPRHGGDRPPLLQATRTVPIVFAQNIDPVGAGFVASLARPGGNDRASPVRVHAEREMARVAEEIAPGLTRAAVVRDSGGLSGIGQWAVIQAARRLARRGAQPDRRARSARSSAPSRRSHGAATAA